MFPVEWVADGTNLTRTRRAENWSHRQLHLARLDGADGASVAFSGDPRCRYLIIITATVSMDEWTRSILPVLLISSIRSRFLQQISNARLTPPDYSLLIFFYIIQPYSTIIFFHWRSSLHSIFFFFFVIRGFLFCLCLLTKDYSSAPFIALPQTALLFFVLRPIILCCHIAVFTLYLGN